MLNRRDDIGIWNSLTAGKLAEILRDVPPDARLTTNRVGGIAVLVGEPGKEDDWEQIGHIDITNECYTQYR
jgi:hypothetical protein